MDSPQILQFVDRAVCAKTGKHLNDLQRRIIAGILKNQKYADVSETHGYSAQHVKKVSHELLQMLSDIFGEQVKKSNLESVLERQINLNINLGNKNTNHNKNSVSIGSINNCPEPSTPTPDKSQPETPDFHGNNQANIEKIGKLRQFGLSDEQIAEVLELPLDVVQQVDFEE
ncbi:MAG: hypothetical protein JGK21_11705 [Microcoleus sp. PH2017_22_RUC_O_B]|uniref:hypothetical protein n=1 Tax=unclassified Microcoleus TaxID=2642155 RepID=UPI001D6A0F7C|nr:MULTISPECIES: hypothetical protein [unclassified Microcoleus]MCC3528847.1 hypothetical protein [Microcoleus sp. PH2017_21_RUC_O_A]MCC3541025.1 hypothetical protein [Microcoleus sp. PH2017_22_RUC_O_B]